MKTIRYKNARFTVFENGVIRMEYSKNRSFCDLETLFALKPFQNSGKKLSVKVEKGENALVVETPLIVLTYKENGKPFNRRNLTARLKINGKSIFWYPSKKNTDNLGGAVVTLDGCYGDRDLPDGFIARDGWHTVDDSRSSVIENGEIRERDVNHLSDIYLFVYGNDYKGALKSLARISGKALLPRKYMLGSWYSRWYGYTSEEFIGITDEYEKNDFPLDILVMDMDWHHHDWQTPEGSPRRTTYGFGHAGGNMGWTGYSWNERLIPDPAYLIKTIKDRGIAVSLNDHPADGIRDCETSYPEFAALMGLDAEKKENMPFLCGDRKYMEAFFECAHRPADRLGVDFWWLDWQQDGVIPSVPGMKNQKVLPWLNYLYYKDSARDGKRGASYSRFGGLGDQRRPMFFSGDIACIWEALAFEIKMTVASANSMCFWWGHDIGGFFSPSGERNGEMFLRWVQFGAVSAAMKLHSCGEDLDRRPWKWDSDTCAGIREAFHLRSRLFPAIYSAAYESYAEDVPFMRPIYYEHPEREESYAYPHEFYLGGSIFCAPIFALSDSETGITEKEVYLPEGTWYNFFTGARHKGLITEKFSDMTHFPLYFKAGVPIPMQSVRSRMGSGVPEEVIIRLYLPDNGSDETFDLIEDDGITDGYRHGEILRTSMRCLRKGDTITLSVRSSGTFSGAPEHRRFIIELYGAKEVKTDLPIEYKNGAAKIGALNYDGDELTLSFGITE